MRAAVLAILTVLATAAVAQDEAGMQFFEAKIRPLLAEQCFGCHSHTAKKLKASLYLDSRDGVLKGGESGPAIVPGHPEQSRLVESVGYRNVDLQMPPKDKLSDQQIADLTAWVKMGAPWGASAAPSTATKVEEFDLARRKARHWAWQPVRPQPPPAVEDNAWPKDPIDQFILARLEANHLKPAPPADRRTLIRRVTFALTGLPPTPQEVDAFLYDPSPKAFETVVDRLLGSPAFGECWARHWLDLVRYAETMGHEFDYPIPNAWRYRDYVIRAFNQDLPYDRFLTEQVAGDLLPDPRRAADGTNESVIGTGFFFLGEDVHSPVDVRQHQADVFDNRIDVLGKSMLGLTVACARCHDHKFDAISAADYYALYGYLKSTRYTQATLNDRAIAAAVSELTRAKRQVRQAIARQWLARLDTLPASLSVPMPSCSSRAGDREIPTDGWRSDGFGLGRACPTDFVVGDEKRPIAAFAGPAVLHSGLLSDRLEGAARSPAFVLDKRYLHLSAAGSNARINLVVDNFNLIRDPIYGTLKQAVQSKTPRWITIDLQMWQGREAYLELIDNSVADPAGPAASPGGWISLGRALLSDDATPPKGAGATESVGNAAELLRPTLEAWAAGRSDDLPGAPGRAALLARTVEKNLLPTVTPEAAALVREYRRIEATIPRPVYATAAADGQAADEHLFIRGNPKNPGPVIPRRFLEALSPLGTWDSACGTRLDLARRIASPDNPLTARVMVNRIWHHLFGRGIVASVDNFGALGEAPTHPELLDHLATRFVRDGWSVKRLIRSIVLTQTWQQSARGDESADAADPENKLLHRANVRRLEAEAIRDVLLTLSGHIDHTMGGPGVAVHLTPFMDGRGKPATSGPLDGAGRRSVYLEVRRNFLPPMLLAFDTPIPFNTMGRRSVSNVPAQALILLNDPFVHQQAQLWAKSVMDRETDERARVSLMYAQAFSRPPTEDEFRTLHAFLGEQGAWGGVDGSGRREDERLWTDLANVLINTKEMIFLN